MSDVTTNRIEDLEYKFAYQESLLETLNSLVTEQQNRIVTLERQQERMQQRLTLLYSEAGLDIHEVEKPPHY